MLLNTNKTLVKLPLTLTSGLADSPDRSFLSLCGLRCRHVRGTDIRICRPVREIHMILPVVSSVWSSMSLNHQHRMLICLSMPGRSLTVSALWSCLWILAIESSARNNTAMYSQGEVTKFGWYGIKIAVWFFWSHAHDEPRTVHFSGSPTNASRPPLDEHPFTTVT
jgi:hypothetical protein